MSDRNDWDLHPYDFRRRDHPGVYGPLLVGFLITLGVVVWIVMGGLGS